MKSTYRRRTIAGTISGLAAGCLLVGLVVLIVQTWTVSQGVANAQRQNANTIELVQDQQGQTQELIAVVNHFTALIVACADQPGTQSASDLEECAVKRLQEEATERRSNG